MFDKEADREIRQLDRSRAAMIHAVNNHGLGIVPTREHRYQQRQRRIYERTGVHVPLFRVRDWDNPDYLKNRAMWRRQGRALSVRSVVVGGVRQSFLAP